MKVGTKRPGKGNIEFCDIIHCDVNTFRNYIERLECFFSDGLERFITHCEFLIYNLTNALDGLKREDCNHFPVQILPTIVVHPQVTAESRFFEYQKEKSSIL
jgi:hypothetical protein